MLFFESAIGNSMLMDSVSMRKQSQHVAGDGWGVACETRWSHRIMKVVRSSSLLLALAAAWAVFFTVGGGSTPQNANITTIYDLWDSVSHGQA